LLYNVIQFMLKRSWRGCCNGIWSSFRYYTA